VEQVDLAFAMAALLHCRKCNSDKPRDAFNRNASSKTGHQSQCRDCSNAWQRDYYKTNPERRASVLARSNAVARDPAKNREHYERRRNDPDRWGAILERQRENNKTPERQAYMKAYHAEYMATPEGRETKAASAKAWRQRPDVRTRTRAQENERRSADFVRVNGRRREAYRSDPGQQARNMERRRADHFAAMDGVFRVYFIASPAMGAIKIGRTRGVAIARLLGLQTASPDELRLLGVIRNATHDDETALHRKFKHLRIRGEWFTASPELIGYIDEHATADE
jgi:hypothetical protein